MTSTTTTGRRVSNTTYRPPFGGREWVTTAFSDHPQRDVKLEIEGKLRGLFLWPNGLVSSTVSISFMEGSQSKTINSLRIWLSMMDGEIDRLQKLWSQRGPSKTEWIAIGCDVVRVDASCVDYGFILPRASS